MKNSEKDTLCKLLNSSNEEYIHTLYRLILKREADQSGYQYYLDRLQKGISKIKIMKQIFLSNEAKKNIQNLGWIKDIIGNEKTILKMCKDTFSDTVVDFDIFKPSKKLMENNIKISVVILTKNPGKIFREVLLAVLSQEVSVGYEVLVIDSGSTDGTLEYIGNFPYVKLYQISSNEFGHGKTRNYGVSLAKGEFVAMLTHDALPKNEHWLAKMLEPFELDEKVAGVFGRHEAYANARLCTKRDIRMHFDSFRNWPKIIGIADPQRYSNDEGYRQVLHYFSDNNACLRKSVWEKIRYPEVDFAEDQVWAKMIVEAGYRKAYSDEAIVYHSHDYSVKDTLRRSFDESRALKNLFGYNLCPTLLQAFKQVKAGTKVDKAYLNDKGGSEEENTVFIRHCAKQAGYFFGAYQGIFSKFIFKILSLDNSIRNQNIKSKKDKNIGIILNSFADINLDAKLLKNDLIGFFDFVRTEDAGVNKNACHQNEKSILWIIPDFGIGSGGHLNIFRFIYFLEKYGFKNSICIFGHHSHDSTSDAKEKIDKHFFKLNADVFLGLKNIPNVNYAFATSWITAYALRGINSTRNKLYFVQDYEPFFYSKGSEYYFAEETYKFGFTGICAGNWLSEKLKTEFSMTTYPVSFSYDKDLYIQTEHREFNVKRVFCYCRPPTTRRGFETAMLALDIVGKHLENVEFIFAGWDMSNYYFPYPHLNAGTLSLDALPDLYSQCDVGLIISFTNLSLLPLELMSCGCVVVSNKGDNNEWLLNEENSILSDQTPTAIAEVIIEVLQNDTKRYDLQQKAKIFAEKTDWETEVIKVMNILNKLS